MRRFIFCATLVMLITSCMKNNIEVDVVQRTEDFTATVNINTRADLDGTAVIWNADDLLSIFTNTSHNRKYQIKDLSANGRSATFEYADYTGSDKTPITSNYAVYPYDADATISGDVITTTLAPTQIYNADCDLKYALMSAKSQTNNFSFVNSGALLRFNISTILPDTFDLKYIKLNSLSHNIAGEVTINTTDHIAIVTDNGNKEIRLTDIGATIDTDVRSFYIAMPAMTFAKGDLSVTFSFADGDKSFSLPSFDLEQGKIKTIDYVIRDADDFTGETPGDDTPAKLANNEIWYTTSDGTTITPKINGIVSNVYENGKGIITFSGNISQIGDSAFEDCRSLTSITLPDIVSRIGMYAFRNCSKLTNITIPDNVTSIGAAAFWKCSSLTSVTIPNSVTWINDDAFRDCSSLTSVIIPDNVTTIGYSIFQGCSSLTSISGKFASADNRCLVMDGVLKGFAPGGLTAYKIPDDVTSIDKWSFMSCSELTSVRISNSVTYIGHQAFSYCSSLTDVTISDSVRAIYDYAFSNCISLKSITIPASVTWIGYSTFEDCSKLTSVYCKNSTPPTLGDRNGYLEVNTFKGNASGRKIYVPSASVTAYKNAVNWKGYANDILADPTEY